jgi:hypothetical protein
MPTSNDRKLHAVGKRIALCSHITASDTPVLKRWRPAVAKSARGLGAPVS